MADHASDDKVFDFANTEFTREDLVQALNDMVHEYKTLSHTFEEIKAENASLKNSSAESSSDDLEDTDSLKTDLSRLKIENDLLRNEASELKAEVDKLTKEMSSWNQSTRSLFKLYESQKPLNDKTGVGFNYDSSHGETSTQSQPVYITGTPALYRLPEMASSLISNSHHIDFESVFRLDDAEFFANSSVREDGMVVSTIGGTLALYRLPEMASSLISNSHHIDFESVFRLDDAGMVQMFETLIATGLKEFLGCPAVFYEDALTKFFTNSSVREDGMVVSTIGGTAIEISQAMFAAALSCPPRAKGYAIQICVLLKNIPGLELGDSKAFPAPRILNEKTVHRIVSVNENVGVEEVGEAPRAKKTPVKKTMSKKRQAAGEAEVAPFIKKKRSTKGKPAAARRISLDKQVEDTTADEEDSVEGTVDKVSHVPVQVAPILDDVDMIIGQVISESADLSSNKKDQGDKLVDETDIGDDFDEWLDSSFPVFDSRVDEPVVATTNLEKAASSKQSAERQSTQMNDLKKGLMAPVGTIFQDLFDIKKNQRAQEAKLNALDGQVAAIRNEQLEFQNKISADLLSLSTQFADIVDYIRGGDAKKGEGGSSSRPPPKIKSSSYTFRGGRRGDVGH
ncbi:hypothetical protein F511_12940 [Dorcoceras hygrometricum]|uniref:Uncharacterized protein n=1 Tax=Dorcoceras hygrometricum TaxID=472368 RepID=A0A2Z7CAY2_9LAMI|nr:hypothetical protein F511_12940 [Dorcoceras hygrometricum]